MKSRMADDIIRQYKPHAGFFDLSHKPKGLSKTAYAKILSIQNYLATQNERAGYLRKFEPVQWEKLKNLSAQLQQIVFQCWGDSVFQ
jgi:hypothetical protein